MILSFSREDFDALLAVVLRGTEFTAIPALIEGHVVIQRGIIRASLKLPIGSVTLDATVEATDGHLEINIVRAVGLLKGIVRPLVERILLARLKPWSRFVACGRLPNGNIWIGRVGIHVDGVALEADLVTLRVSI